MNERIRQIQVALNMSQKDFAEAIGIAPGALSNIYSNRTNATSNHVKGIHNKFPQINVNWLMFGEGDMYVSSDANASDSPAPTLAADGQEPLPFESAARLSNENVTAISGHEPSLFDQPSHIPADILPFQNMKPATQVRGHRIAQTATSNTPEISAKNFDIKRRQVKEIRVFFDDGTYETFVPGK